MDVGCLILDNQTHDHCRISLSWRAARGGAAIPYRCTE